MCVPSPDSARTSSCAPTRSLVTPSASTTIAQIASSVARFLVCISPPSSNAQPWQSYASADNFAWKESPLPTVRRAHDVLHFEPVIGRIAPRRSHHVHLVARFECLPADAHAIELCPRRPLDGIDDHFAVRLLDVDVHPRVR